jgi:hypothetical protein
VEQAKTTDVTLADDWGDEGPAPRLVLADVLRVLAPGRSGAAHRGRYVGDDPHG